jgi:hypothetical protein
MLPEVIIMDNEFNNGSMDQNENNSSNCAQEDRQCMQDKDAQSNNQNIQNESNNNYVKSSEESSTRGFVRNLFPDNSGRSRGTNIGTAAVDANTRVFIILGWICAALTAFISPLFAIGGIIFGALANRNARGSGNALIITNIVLAVINLIFGLFVVAIMRGLIYSY